jgi:hypothetical protein
MCGCSSFGPDRYGPNYQGRYALLGAQPALPAGVIGGPGPKTDPNCPGCRVGAYGGSETTPPIPFDQAYLMNSFFAPAGQVQQLQYAPPQLQPQLAYAWPGNMVPVTRLR